MQKVLYIPPVKPFPNWQVTYMYTHMYIVSTKIQQHTMYVYMHNSQSVTLLVNAITPNWHVTCTHDDV